MSFIGNFIERLILSKKWIRRLSFFFACYIEKDNFSTMEERELDLIKTKKIIIINRHWDIRCPNSMKFSGEFVRKHLRAKQNYLTPANNHN